MNCVDLDLHILKFQRLSKAVSFWWFTALFFTFLLLTMEISSNRLQDLYRQGQLTTLSNGYIRFKSIHLADLSIILSENKRLQKENQYLRNYIKQLHKEFQIERSLEIDEADDCINDNEILYNDLPKDIIILISKYVLSFDPQNLCWDSSVKQAKIYYSDNDKLATVAENNVNRHNTIRTKFFESGRHLIAFQIEQAGHVGIGILDNRCNILANTWIGYDSASYGHWDNVYAMHSNHSLLSKYGNGGGSTYPTKTDMIVEIDLDIDNRKFLWICDGKNLTKYIQFSRHFRPPIAFCACLCRSGDSVRIIGYQQL